MTAVSSRCPPSAELERAFWEREPEIRTHAKTCQRCKPHWDDISALAAACTDLAAAPTPTSTRHADVREALRSRSFELRDSSVFTKLRALSPAVAGAAAVLLAWWLWPEEAPSAGSETAATATRARVLDHDSARYFHVGTQPDEVVRLVDGTVSVDVDALGAGERFRVITGDAELEVNDSVFDITAHRDRLVAVRVVSGAVQVRGARHEVVVVSEGLTWNAPISAAVSPQQVDGRAHTGVEPAVVERPEPGSPPEVIATRRREPELSPSSPPPAAPEPVAVQEDVSDAGILVPFARRAGQEMFLKGWELLRSGEFLEAADELDHAALLANSDTDAEDARYWLAVALARGGKAMTAIQAFTVFLDQYPDSVHGGEATVMLGWLLVERGAYDEAKRRFRAGQKDPAKRVRASAAEGLTAVARAQARNQ